MMPAKGYKVKWKSIKMTEKQWSAIEHLAGVGMDDLSMGQQEGRPWPKWVKEHWQAVQSLQKKLDNQDD